MQPATTFLREKKRRDGWLTQRVEVVVPSLAALLSGSRSDPGGNEDPLFRAVLVHQLTKLSVLLYSRKKRQKQRKR